MLGASCVKPPSRAVKELSREQAIIAAREVLSDAHRKEPYQIVEKEFRWDIYFPMTNVASGTQIMVDKRTGKATVGITR
jgi:hypothetical protein